MNPPNIWLRITATAVGILGTVLAGILIRAIWNEFKGENVGKIIGTLAVLFVFSMVLHWLAKGPSGNSSSRP